MTTDIEIAKSTKLKKITEIAKNIGLDEDEIELYGKYKAKITKEALDKINKNCKNGKIILVTAMNPTPSGEGKTTITIGLGQGLKKIGKKVAIALREPSLGPCFGIKGGATGGGYSQVAPMEDINLHFTGDIHAITSAHNLISALIDNHIKFGNKLNIKNVVWKRVLDLNDRSLRNIVIGLGDGNGTVREDGFMITVASEIMAILCLSETIDDLKNRLSKVVIGYNDDNCIITLKDLECVGAVAVLLKDAIRPNIVQTLEGVFTLVHGGPFANIAHGCNSIIATKTALKLADYVITEAGFGADLGAEKFFDIKCRKANLSPNCVVIVATCRSLKYNSGVDKKNLKEENIAALENGFCNLKRHIENIRKYNLPVIVAINKFTTDTVAELDRLKELCRNEKVETIVCETWEKGGDGAIELADAVVKTISESKNNNFRFLYNLDLPIRNKIEIIAKEIYRAKEVKFSQKALKKIKQYTENGYGNLEVCIAKTQYSFSDNPELLGAPKDFVFNIGDVSLSAGAGFIVCLAGDIMTMPGLPKVPAANAIDIGTDGNIVGLF